MNCHRQKMLAWYIILCMFISLVERWDGIRGNIDRYLEDTKLNQREYDEAVRTVADRYVKYMGLLVAKVGVHSSMVSVISPKVCNMLDFVVQRLKKIYESVSTIEIEKLFDEIKAYLTKFANSVGCSIEEIVKSMKNMSPQAALSAVVMIGTTIYKVFETIAFFIMNNFAAEVALYCVEVQGVWLGIIGQHLPKISLTKTPIVMLTD